jgi:tetratricopeptide (TPR) repeat protein
MCALTPSDTTRKLAEDYYHTAVESLANGDLKAAIHGFRASLAADPGFADAAHGLIHALKDAAEYDEAVAVTQRLIADDPDDVLAHTSLSILYQHQGRIAEAEAAATRAKLLGWKKQLREESTPGNGG